MSIDVASVPVGVYGVQLPSVPGISVGELNLLHSLLAKWYGLRERNRLRAVRYDSENVLKHLGLSTPPQMRNTQLVLGWPAKAVDALARRTHLEGLSLDGDALNSMAVSDLIVNNRFLTLCKQAQVSSLVQGVSFLVVTQGDVESGEPDVVVSAKDALSSTGTWNGRANRMDNFLSINEIDKNGNPTSMNLYIPNTILLMDKKAGKWSCFRTEHVYGVPVEPLVYNADLRRPMGRSRITRPMMSLHDQALRSLFRMEVAAELYHIPQTFLLGANPRQFAGAPWAAILGRLMAIDDNMEKAQLDPSLSRPDIKQIFGPSPAPHMEQVKELAKLYAGEANIPPTSLGIVTDANPSSAEAMSASREDIVHDAEDAISGWTPSILNAVRRMQQVADRSEELPVDMKDLHATWRNPKHESSAQAADAGAKILSVAPWLAETEIGLKKLGLSTEEAQIALRDKARAEASRRASMLLEAATAGARNGNQG